jgi:hypothetical protein
MLVSWSKLDCSVKVFRCQLAQDNAFYQLEEHEGCSESIESQCAGGIFVCLILFIFSVHVYYLVALDLLCI